MPKRVPTYTWAREMGAREKREGRDGKMERLRQEDFVLAGLNAAHIPQPNCGTRVLLQSAAPWRQRDPPVPGHPHPSLWHQGDREGLVVSRRLGWGVCPCGGHSPSWHCRQGHGLLPGSWWQGAMWDPLFPDFSRLFRALGFCGGGREWAGEAVAAPCLW